VLKTSMKNRYIFRFALLIFAAAAIASPRTPAQQQRTAFAPAAVTADDYARAEKFLAWNTTPLIDRMGVRAVWVPGERFWYRALTAKGSEFYLVDAATGTRSTAFDAAKVAAAYSTASGTPADPNKLPFTMFAFSPDMTSISFMAANKKWLCDVAGTSCSATTGEGVNAPPTTSGREGGRRPPPGFNDIPSPDGKRTAFIKNFNLWVRDIATGKETQLTTDGVKDFGYATNNAGWVHSDRPVLIWSPDSKKIATFQQDERGVGRMYLVSTKVGHPDLEDWAYPLPGDEKITTIQRVIIDVDNPKVTRLQMAADEHRSTLCDDVSCGGGFDDNNWSADGRTLAFVSTSRDHKSAKLRIADAATGAVRDVMEEKVATQYESGQGASNWRYLPETNEIIWYSERDNWGHLYLYDATTGQLKNQITKGEFVVTTLDHIDAANRVIYFNAVGGEKGQNPYFSHLYRVGFDGRNMQSLTPEDGTHAVAWSPSEKHFTDSYSKPDVPPTVVLRDETGKILSTIEKADVSRLTAAGWKPPTVISVKSRDGQTDLYGLMFTPTKMDPAKKYPIINNIYPGPQGGSVGGNWGFAPARGDAQALAELGFVVVQIEGTCNPLRSKKFHDMCYGNMADNTLPDQVEGMKQLAQKYPFIDLDRVGIWGHSGGGFATAAAMFRYPDFFKVGISESGNHDNRDYEDDWGERYVGLSMNGPNGKSNYEEQANQNFAKNLKGKLLLAHGTMDDNVPPYNTLLVADALIKANKDFDLLMLPNQHHGYGGATNYMMRRRWDYFVKNLLGVDPPKEYQINQVQVVR
jgi:dipeptidyl-peptidase 4